MAAERTLSVAVRLSRAGAGDPFTLDATFEVPAGITILFGPSGAGKSTTLAAIAGLVRPDEGRVALGADVWFDAATQVDLPVQRRRVAFVFQSLALFPHLTAIGNVAYGMRALARRERFERARELLAKLKVSHLADRKPRTFSGGEAQRVALARAFAIEPRVMLLDEPFSALDRALRTELVRDVRLLVDTLEIPTIHVTHHRNEARALGDRVALLDRGRVVATGTARELLRDEGDELTFAETPMPLRR
jgi:molybdate transport system ATP-binding protein